MTEQAQNPLEARLPFSFAKRHGILITGQGDDSLEVVCLSTIKPNVLLETQRHFSSPFKLRQVNDAEFDQLLQQAYEDQSSQTMESVEGLGDDMDLDSVAQALAEPEDLIENEDDAPIIRLINASLTHAVKRNASDVHVEPFEGRLTVRYRIDGVLRDVEAPPARLRAAIVSRIKLMARLNIAERRLPQDGRAQVEIRKRRVDLRTPLPVHLVYYTAQISRHALASGFLRRSTGPGASARRLMNNPG